MRKHWHRVEELVHTAPTESNNTLKYNLNFMTINAFYDMRIIHFHFRQSPSLNHIIYINYLM